MCEAHLLSKNRFVFVNNVLNVYDGKVCNVRSAIHEKKTPNCGLFNSKKLPSHIQASRSFRQGKQLRKLRKPQAIAKRKVTKSIF